MTYNENIKALECCLDAECYKCPLRKDNNCRTNLVRAIIDLFNRRQAEIERLHNILLSFTNEVHYWSNKKGYDTTELSLIPILNEAKSVREDIKAEAFKEFAERLKEKLADKKYKYVTETNYSKTVNAVIDACISTVDNLEQEMVGDE